MMSLSNKTRDSIILTIEMKLSTRGTDWKKFPTNEVADSLSRGVIADFTTPGESQFYGLPCPYADSLDPMDHFCSFDVSLIIPKKCKSFHT